MGTSRVLARCQASSIHNPHLIYNVVTVSYITNDNVEVQRGSVGGQRMHTANEKSLELGFFVFVFREMVIVILFFCF